MIVIIFGRFVGLNMLINRKNRLNLSRVFQLCTLKIVNAIASHILSDHFKRCKDIYHPEITDNFDCIRSVS